MKKATLLLPLAALLLLCPAVSELHADADGARTLNGNYVWNNRDTSGDLEAVFTPAGDDRWEVSFHFEFRGREHTYSGTAEGSLEGGALAGTVLNDTKKRTFSFSGRFEDGEFRGTHAEVEGTSKYETGTLTLK